MKIRQAAMADASTILKLCARMHGEASLDMPDIDPVKAMHRIVHVIGNGGAYVVGAAKNDGPMTVVGTIGLEVQQDWYSSSDYVADVWLYVHTEHRSLAAWRALKHLAEAMAKDLDVPVRLGVFDGGRDARGRTILGRKTKLYERHGYEPVAVLFQKG